MEELFGGYLVAVLRDVLVYVDSSQMFAGTACVALAPLFTLPYDSAPPTFLFRYHV